MKPTNYYTNQYKKKFNGYRNSHRNRWRLVQRGYLSIQVFALFELYLDIFDFDIKHPSFGVFFVDFDAIAAILSKSPNTIRAWHNQLLDLGLVKRSYPRGYYEIKHPKRYIASGAWGGEAKQYVQREKDQPVEVIFQSIGGKVRKTEQVVQPIEKKEGFYLEKPSAKALSSSTVDSPVSFKIKVISEGRVRSDEEYQKIYDGNGNSNFKNLTPEDMKWIDENIC